MLFIENSTNWTQIGPRNQSKTMSLASRCGTSGGKLARACADAAVFGAVAEQTSLGHFFGIDDARG